MKKLARNAVVALIFLLVSVLVLKFWGGAWSPASRLYFECAAILGFLIALCWRTKAILLPIYAGVLLIPLCLFEAIMQSKGAGADGRVATRLKVEGAKAYATPDSLLGLKPAIDDGEMHVVKTTTDGRPVFDARYHFAKGHRVAHAAAGRPVVWFLGCSLTFGEGLNDADTLPVRVGELTGTDTYNFAFPGWGPHQALRLWDSGELEKRAPKPSLVVFGSFPGHAQRCAGKAYWDFDGPHYQVNGVEPVLQGAHRSVIGVARLHWLLTRMGIIDTRSAQLLSAVLSQPTPADGEQCVALVKMLAQRSQSIGAEFVVLDWRSKESNPAIADAMTAALKTVAPVLEVQSLFDPADPQYQITHDGHPNAAALNQLAQALAHRYGARLQAAGEPPSATP